MLRNIGNLLDVLGDGTEIELVVHGPDLAAVITDSPHAVQMRDLLGRELSVVVCANTALCGDPTSAGFRAPFAGNQYMVLPELIATFLDTHDDVGSVFYETLPPELLSANYAGVACGWVHTN